MTFKKFYEETKALQEMKIDDKFSSFGEISEDELKELQYLLDLRRKGKMGWKKVAEEKYKDYVIELFNKKDMFEVFATMNNQIVGQTEAQKRPHKGVESYPQVHFTFVHKDYQGQGLGFEMHRMLVDNVGGITSDFTLTTGSYKMLKGMSNKGYNIAIYDEYGKIVPFIDDEQALGNRNRMFVITKATKV